MGYACPMKGATVNTNPELQAIFAANQADRRGVPSLDLWERDAARRRRVEELLDEGALHSAEDYLHAASIFQHGERLEHYWQAHELAMQAVDLGHKRARWLAAAAYDRWLMHQGLPQKFGTQYRRERGSWQLYEYDPATTDEERARWDVPALSEALAYLAQLNAEPAAPLSPAKAAPRAGRSLGAASLADLKVEIVEIDRAMAGGFATGMPEPEPLDLANIDIIIPSYLPQGLELRRLGDGCCAINASGAIKLTWFELLLPPGEPLVMAWNSADGPAPELLTIDLGERSAILATATWSAVAPDRPPVIVARASLDTCWLVGGHLPHAELAQVIASLPVR